eukprot:TRINITY_DN3157_c0_g2_i1.p1 TRINITY_DN3157_c0_g2~~TRINITY_DN3157_c0_g2_i1.p1  ORF type:complete len:896 (-),score=58.83 TRINITY_DN3157_c0_g2_i1:2849-5536(-)
MDRRDINQYMHPIQSEQRVMDHYVPVVLENGNQQYSWNPYTFQLYPASVSGINGNVNNSANASDETEQRQASGTSSSSLGKSLDQPKPTRKYYKGPQICQCCKCDLKNVKEYNRRYRVCPTCQKAEYVQMDNTFMRYCQQCGRFQPLIDFSGNRRSCRARLELHNARRRKNSAASKSLNSPNVVTFDPSKFSEQALSTSPVQGKGKDVGQVMDPAVAAFNNIIASQDLPITVSGFGSPDAQRMLNETPLRLLQCRDSARNLFPEKKSSQGLYFLPPQTQTSSSSFNQQVYQLSASMDIPTNLRNSNQLTDPAILNSGSKNMTTMLPNTEQPVVEADDEFMVELQSILEPSSTPVPDLPKTVTNLDVDSLPGVELLFPESFHYEGYFKLCNLTMKLFEMEPHQIPWGLKEHLHAAINMGIVVEGFLRPGCIHFASDGVVSIKAEVETTAEQVAQRLVDQCTFDVYGDASILIHVNETHALIRNGQIVQSILRQCHKPVINEVSDMIITPGSEITIKGYNLEGAQLLIRQNGQYLDFEVIEKRNEQYKIRIPCDSKVGLLKIQAVAGPCFSQVLACAIVQDEVAQELQALSKDQQLSLSIDLGLILELSDHMYSKLINGNAGRRLYIVDDIKALVPVACKLFGFAVSNGFAALANATILPSVTCCKSALQFSSAIAQETANRLPLIFMAVRGRNPAVIRVLASWAQWLGFTEERGYSLRGVVGPHQLTPLHLAVLLKDDGRMATALVDLCPEGIQVLREARNADGLTPFEFALQYGCEGLQATLKNLIMIDSPVNIGTLCRNDTAHVSCTITSMVSISEAGSIPPFLTHILQQELQDDQEMEIEVENLAPKDIEIVKASSCMLLSNERRKADLLGDSATQIAMEIIAKSKSFDEPRL